MFFIVNIIKRKWGKSKKERLGNYLLLVVPASGIITIDILGYFLLIFLLYLIIWVVWLVILQSDYVIHTV